jgi:NAD(P)-dependent dehydrogenase (short-subunit alcohol dehydrogenase family)
VTALTGQLALVTGASRGIGAASAEALAAAGAHVVLTARDAKALEAVEERIFAGVGSATIAPVDLADPDGIARLAAALAERWGKLDVLVHCAAVLPDLTSVTDIDQTALSKALTTNVLAVQALLATKPRAFWGAYAASKAAGEVLVECYAQEVRNTSKVRVAIVDPAATRTTMRAKAYPGEDPATLKLPEVVAARLLALLGEQFASPHRETVNHPA